MLENNIRLVNQNASAVAHRRINWRETSTDSVDNIVQNFCLFAAKADAA
jgi:hypothetical protein